MNEDLSLDEKLEQLGTRMRPGADFVGRVMEKLGQHDAAGRRSSRGLLGPWGWAGSAAALVMLAAGLMAQFRSRPRPAPVTPDATGTAVNYERSTSRWEATFRRPVTLPGDSPAWEYRTQEFDRVQWTDPTSHATLERNVPRDGVSLIVLDKY
jgi:hypothetical protein